LLSRYSSSPALHLRIGESRLRDVLYGVLCLVNCFALGLIYARGYQALAFTLTPLTLAVLWRLRRDPMLGARLSWTKGTWTLECNDLQRVIRVGKRSVSMPWLIYLAYRDLTMGTAGHLWLFVDSLNCEELRLLRVRLTLER
jgi:hypothetical protein